MSVSLRISSFILRNHHFPETVHGIYQRYLLFIRRRSVRLRISIGSLILPVLYQSNLSYLHLDYLLVCYFLSMSKTTYLG